MKETIKKMAELAHIGLNEKELALYAKNADAILEYVKQLGNLNTDNIEPTSHAVDVQAHLREDSPKEPCVSSQIVSLAPRHENSLIEVPKVVDVS